MQALVERAVKDTGRLNVMVNNAGLSYPDSIATGKFDHWKEMFETNVWGPARMVQALAPGMRARNGGAIVNVTSLAGRAVGPLNGYYSASKWALDASDAYPCVTATQCPSAPPQGAACQVEVPGVPCAYTGLLCFCEAASDAAAGADGHWGCYGPPADPACPALLPNLGEGCATQALECHYSSNGCTAPPNSTVFCRGGAWEEGQELLCHSK